MELNLDEALQELLEWDLSITIGKVSYKTEPPTVATVAAIRKSLNGGDEMVLAEVVKRFFADPQPDMSGWRMEHLLAAIKSVYSYWNVVIGKNSRSLSSKIDGEMAKMTGRSSK